MNTLGSAKTQQSLSGSLEVYQVWCSSPNAFTDPNNASGINIRTTGDVRDPTQKNFELLVQGVALRALPVILQEPTATADLAASGSQSLTGEGFVWCFGTERAEQFGGEDDPTKLLREEMDGLVLNTGVVLRTSGGQQNIEFNKKSTLC
jgi:hypothetical protein